MWWETGEEIEYGITSGSSSNKINVELGNNEIDIEEFIKNINKDITPYIDLFYSKTLEYVDIQVKVPYLDEYLKGYTLESIERLEKWYIEKYNIPLHITTYDYNRVEFYFHRPTLNNYGIDLLLDKALHYNISLQHLDNALELLNVKVYKLLLEEHKELIEKLNNRENELDKKLFPNNLEEPIKNIKIKLINGTVGMETGNLYIYEEDNNIRVYKGTGKYWYSDFFYYNMINSDFIKFENLNSAMEFISNRFLNGKDRTEENIKLLQNFIKEKLELIKKNIKDIEFLKEVVNNQKEYNKYEIYERTTKNGKSYINMKYQDYIISCDYKTTNEILLYNKNCGETKNKVAPVIHYILRNGKKFL